MFAHISGVYKHHFDKDKLYVRCPSLDGNIYLHNDIFEFIYALWIFKFQVGEIIFTWNVGMKMFRKPGKWMNAMIGSWGYKDP